MQSILVTGASGFIGKRLMPKLKEAGFDPIGCSSKEGNIWCSNFFDPYSTKQVDFVIHLAGKVFVPDSWINPLEFQLINTIGTGNVLEFCRKNNLPMIYVSSYLYGEPRYLPIDEFHPLIAFNPYALSKLNAENLCEFYAEQFNLSISILRPFNLYGPNQSNNFLIPKIIKQAIDGNTIHLENLSSKRDYLYVDDFVGALISCMIKQRSGLRIFNIGSGFSLGPEDIINSIATLTGAQYEIVCEENVRKNEISDIVADIKRAKFGLEWTPNTSIQAGLMRCLDSASGRSMSDYDQNWNNH